MWAEFKKKKKNTAWIMRDVIRIVSCLVSGAISRRHLSDNWTETAAASPWRLNRNKREKDIRGLFLCCHSGGWRENLHRQRLKEIVLCSLLWASMLLSCRYPARSQQTSQKWKLIGCRWLISVWHQWRQTWARWQFSMCHSFLYLNKTVSWMGGHTCYWAGVAFLFLFC